MKIDNFIAMCRCPLSGSNLKMDSSKTFLLSETGYKFPLLKGRIPNLLPSSKIEGSNISKNFDNLKTSISFSNQWSMLNKNDTIWGFTKDELKKNFFDTTGFSPELIKGKLILDIGCGHGTYPIFLSELGANVIGFDISNGFLKAEETLTQEQKESVYYIQGDVFHFPIKPETVDLVWCSGVLHHTPDTKKAFNMVNKVVKSNGRFYLWLYKNVFYTKPLIIIRKVTTRIPEKILVPICYILAPFFALTKYILNRTKLNYRYFEKRSLRENALSIHDTLAPPYRWHHEIDEVIEWFKEANFTNITVSEDTALGFGIYGDKI